MDAACFGFLAAQMVQTIMPMVIVASGTLRMIEPDDHVIVFVVNKRTVPKVEKLFQVSVSFL